MSQVSVCACVCACACPVWVAVRVCLVLVHTDVLFVCLGARAPVQVYVWCLNPFGYQSALPEAVHVCVCECICLCVCVCLC